MMRSDLVIYLVVGSVLILLILLPRWLWRRRATGALRALPELSSLAPIYDLYYQLLDRAGAQGVALNAADTPRERSALLCEAFPDLPVERLTAVFEAACYGREPASASEVERLREQCDF